MRKLVLLALVVATGTSAADDQPGADGIAYAKLGLTLWRGSCPVPEIDGTCASSKPRPKLAAGRSPVRCGPEARPLVTIVRRDPRKVKDAMTALDNAVIALERLPGRLGGDEAAARALHGQARLVEADLDFETYLALELPRGLDFEPSASPIARNNLKRFDDWVSQKSGLGRRLVAKYEAVLTVKDTASSIGATARIAQISQDFFEALSDVPIPAAMRSGPQAAVKVAAFCDKLAAVAEPAETQSINAFETCLAKSTELSWFDESSKLCERALQRIRPALYPAASELHAAPTATIPIMMDESNP